MFDRKEESLSKIKFLIISQEPGFSLKKNPNLKTSKKIEDFLIQECLKSKSSGTSPINKTIEIFRKFNPSKDNIYWTHALKCVPIKNDKEIGSIWKECSYYCARYFKNELNLIPSKKLVIIAFGNYALALCRHILEDKQLAHAKGIIKYIKAADPKNKFSFGMKDIFLFPFLHPSNRERVLKRYDKNNKVKNREREFIEIIQQNEHI
ncbi:MAG: uracil-DNA glycosylase family protein [Candidatus Odinarchaeia archaeon]